MYPRFMYPFLVYRSLFGPVLVLAAIVVPCWLAYRLYRLRAAGCRPSLLRELLLLAFVVYLSALAAATLTPNHGSVARARATEAVELRPDLASLTCSPPFMPTGSIERAFCVRNAGGNVVLFLPLGILIPLLWSRVRFGRGVQIAITLSLTIEVAQYLSRNLGSYRSPDVNDVLLNVFGACLGLALVSLLRLRPGPRPAVTRA